MRGTQQHRAMEERYCSVCCDAKAKPAVGARPWRIPPNTLLQQALLACTLNQKSEKSSTYTASSPLLTAVTALNFYAGVLKTGDANRRGDYQKRQVNDRLVNWLCDIRSCRDLIDDNIPIENASHPFILNIKKLGEPSDSDSETFAVDNLCESCEKLIRTFAIHERKYRAIATSLFKATVKSLINLKTSKKSTTIRTSSNKEITIKKIFFDQNITTCNPGFKDDTVSATAASLVPKRKRGRPRKVPSDFEASNSKRKKSEIDCTKSVCPFCSKVYSIEHSFVHNCLAYRNSLRCVRCNVFSSTYVRFEKHLEVYHHEKRLLCCQVSNCNQRFVSEPAFKWHSHFHTIEEEQRVYAVDTNVVCAASTVLKRVRLPDVSSDAIASKVRTTDDIDGPDVSSVTVISNDVDRAVSSTLDCSDPSVLLLSESTVDSVPQTVSCIITNTSNVESLPSQFNPSSKYGNHCSSSEMNKSQSLLCSGSLSSTQPDNRLLAKPLFVGAQSTQNGSQNLRTSHTGGDRQNNKNSKEPVFVFVGAQRNPSNIIALDVYQRSTQGPPEYGSKYLSQQQFVPISMSDFSVNLNQIKVKGYYPSIKVDQVSLNTVQSTIPDSHLRPECSLLQCNSCQQYFPNQSALNVHRTSQCGKDGQQLFSCQRCSSSFLSPLNLKRHTVAECQSNSNEDIALDTNQDSIKESGFAQHLLMDHRVGEHRYQCPVCEQVFYIISDLVEHLNGHDSTETCTCYICSVNIKSKPREAAHRDHFITLESPSQIWMCAMCQVSFLTAEALKKHCTDANHNIESLGARKLTSQHTTNLQMAHLDSNYPVHQMIHHDNSVHVELVDVKQETVTHDTNHQIVVHNTNHSMANCDATSTLAMSCPQSAAKVSVGLQSHTVNHIVAIDSQPNGHGSYSTNAKQQLMQSFSNGSSSFRVGRPMQLQSSDVANTRCASINPVLAGRAGDLSGDFHPSVNVGAVVHPTMAETETPNMSQSLFTNSQSSYCQGCGMVALDQNSLASHVRSCPLLQPKVEAPFVDDHFISTNENLSVIRALESSSGNTLTSIDHLIGSVDDMDYFT